MNYIIPWFPRLPLNDYLRYSCINVIFYLKYIIEKLIFFLLYGFFVLFSRRSTKSYKSCTNLKSLEATWQRYPSFLLVLSKGLPFSGKESSCQCKRHRFDPWVHKIPWRREWQPAPVFLPRKSHGQRNLAGYSPGHCKRAGHNLVTKQQQLIT